MVIFSKKFFEEEELNANNEPTPIEEEKPVNNGINQYNDMKNTINKEIIKTEEDEIGNNINDESKLQIINKEENEMVDIEDIVDDESNVQNMGIARPKKIFANKSSKHETPEQKEIIPPLAIKSKLSPLAPAIKSKLSKQPEQEKSTKECM